MKRTGNHGKLGIPKFESPKVTEVAKSTLWVLSESDESDENHHKPLNALIPILNTE